MKTFYIKSARKIMQNQNELEKKLKVKIIVKGQNISISGSEVNEFFAERVLRAMDFPFLIEDTLLLLNEDYLFEVINIKSHTHRKDLKVIRGRIIGADGRTLKVLEELTGAIIAVKDNNVAVIARSDDFGKAVQGVISIIQGSKQANVYAYLEKANKRN